MKYMGSKRTLLRNGLGNLISKATTKASRFVDLMCGGASVAWFVAERFEVPVLAFDLQIYAAVIAASVIERQYEISPSHLEDIWIRPARNRAKRSRRYRSARALTQDINLTPEIVQCARVMCQENAPPGYIWRPYGGHYFSPSQALQFDFLLEVLPQEEPLLTVCLAAIISAASRAAAAPGHTAQPFQPTPGALPHIQDAWSRDPFTLCERALREICPRNALVKGIARAEDAQSALTYLVEGDLVFVDLPYTGVHYSRFYHVLETIARGGTRGDVTGVGRYPCRCERPQSAFSNRGQSVQALVDLLRALNSKGCDAIFTFPNHECSNGLSGDLIASIASDFFRVSLYAVNSRFSTLGGNRIGREARQRAEELIISLSPR